MRSHVQRIVLSQFDPRLLIKCTLIVAPELFDLLAHSPVLLSEQIRRLEKSSTSGTRIRQLDGVKEIVLAGFLLMACVIEGTMGGPWPLWAALLLLAVILAIKGLK